MGGGGGLQSKDSQPQLQLESPGNFKRKKEREKPMLKMHPRTTESEFLKNGGSTFVSDSEPLLLFSISNSPVFPAGSLI